jgi:hypothetical protein
LSFGVDCSAKCSAGGELLSGIAKAAGVLGAVSTPFGLKHFGTVMGIVGASAGAASSCK